MTKEEAIKYLQQLYPNGGHCWLDEQRIEAIGMAINALQEVPAPKIFEDMLNAKTPTESLGISAEEHEKIIDQCLYGKEPEMVDIDDLPKEELVSEELEKAAEDYGIRQGLELKPFAIKYFKAGANWQKQQDQSTIELAEDHAMLAGMEKMKEEMVAKAIDGVLSSTITGSEQVVSAYVGYGEYGKDGDKVKVIVIKED